MKAEMTEIVMPSHTNHMGTCFGGTIMSWIDTVAAIAAQRAVGSVVTASVDSIQFKKPIKLGDIVTLKASVNMIWGSSMEVGVKITCQSPVMRIHKFDLNYTELGGEQQVCKAYLTFVAINNRGTRNVSDKLDTSSFNKEDLRRCEDADLRRTMRLKAKK